MACLAFVITKRCFVICGQIKKTDEPYILFVEGQHLDHSFLEKGNRSRMKIYRINPNLDLPMDSIQQLLNEALDLYRNGTIKVK